MHSELRWRLLPQPAKLTISITTASIISGGGGGEAEVMDDDDDDDEVEVEMEAEDGERMWVRVMNRPDAPESAGRMWLMMGMEGFLSPVW